MALTVQKLALRLAKYIGVTTFDPSDASNTTPLHQAGLREGDVEEILACINGALQEMWSSAPRALCFRRESAVLYAPETHQITVVNGATEISSFAGYAAWMEGCSVAVSGEKRLNEIEGASSLLRAHTGPSGAVNVTVYSDCVSFGPEVIECSEPFIYHGTGTPAECLICVTSRAEFEALRSGHGGYSGVPTHYFADTRYLPNEGRVRMRVHLYRVPDRMGTMEYGVRLNAPEVTDADLSAVGDTGRVLPIPHGWGEAVLLPLALQRFTAHPAFEAEKARKELERQAAVARRMLAAVTPQRRVTRMVPTFR